MWVCGTPLGVDGSSGDGQRLRGRAARAGEGVGVCAERERAGRAFVDGIVGGVGVSNGFTNPALSYSHDSPHCTRSLAHFARQDLALICFIVFESTFLYLYENSSIQARPTRSPTLLQHTPHARDLHMHPHSILTSPRSPSVIHERLKSGRRRYCLSKR